MKLKTGLGISIFIINNILRHIASSYSMQLIFAGLNFHDPYDELRQRQTCSIFVQEIGKICSTLDQLEADLSTTQAIG